LGHDARGGQAQGGKGSNRRVRENCPIPHSDIFKKVRHEEVSMVDGGGDVGAPAVSKILFM